MTHGQDTEIGSDITNVPFKSDLDKKTKECAALESTIFVMRKEMSRLSERILRLEGERDALNSTVETLAEKLKD